MLRFADFCADRQQTTDDRQQTTDKLIALPPAAHAHTRGNNNNIMNGVKASLVFEKLMPLCGLTHCMLFLYYRLFRDVDAALIVFDVRVRDTFRRAISDITEPGPDGKIRRSWFKVVNDRSGDVPPIKILGNLIAS